MSIKEKKLERKKWNKYFIDIAKQVATRATCNRKHVGAVIVKNRRILSTGYNGSLYGDDHCDSEGHLIQKDIKGRPHCIRTVHAEVNAIAHAARHGCAIDEADIYITASPCWNCFKIIVNSGIKNVFYNEDYYDETVIWYAQKLKDINLIQIKNGETNEIT